MRRACFLWSAGSSSIRRASRIPPKDIPMLKEFLQHGGPAPEGKTIDIGGIEELPPYISAPELKRKVFLETYGCQMNVSDSEVVASVLVGSGHYELAKDEEEAEVILLNTCAIRENAEQKVWQRLDVLKKRKTEKQPGLMIGVLGCMAERLKTRLLEADKLVDLVAGPDAYKTIPHLLRIADPHNERMAINTMLSADETYADIAPVRLSEDKVSAFVSIMRGCNNMCSFCVVPFTRGRERSRPMESILNEVAELSRNGFKEVVLLGQNVNVYNDGATGEGADFQLTPNFGTMQRIPSGGKTFVELMDKVSLVDPDMRIRFTSPHPKAFPRDLLHLIAERPNICKSIHVPAQSGSSRVLERMRRNYTREAYLELIQDMRRIIPNVAISTDMISGFCGETEEDHQETLSLMREVEFDAAFMFAYSLREKTHAHRALVDDVPEEVKQRRLREVIDTFHTTLHKKVQREQIGKTHVVLIEGDSKRSANDFQGRADNNMRVVFPKPASCNLSPGQYALVQIESATTITLKGKFQKTTTLKERT